MTWFRVDDSFWTHPKVLAIPRKDRPTAVGLWTLAGSYSGNHLTDGLVGTNMLDEFGVPKRYALQLVEVRLWHAPGDDCPSCGKCEKCLEAGIELRTGYRFHDFHEWNPSRAEVKQNRAEISEAGGYGNHLRWHVKRGKPNPECVHCQKGEK